MRKRIRAVARTNMALLRQLWLWYGHFCQCRTVS